MQLYNLLLYKLYNFMTSSMKFILKPLLKYYLKYITKLVLLVHRPTVIAIAGSVNKTFAKDEIKEQLQAKGIKFRANPKSFNTEIGLPLAILYLSSGYNCYRDWLPIIFKALAAIFQRDFPKFLILELGVSGRGDMKYLLSIIKPKIALITDITQRYLESFVDMDALVKEYKQLATRMGASDLLILNYDNIRIRQLAKFSRAKIETFGLQKQAAWRALDVQQGSDGLTFKVEHNKKIASYHINRFGRHHIYASLAGLVVEDYLERNC